MTPTQDAYNQLEALADELPETPNRLDALMTKAKDDGERFYIWEPPAEERAKLSDLGLYYNGYSMYVATSADDAAAQNKADAGEDPEDVYSRVQRDVLLYCKDDRPCDPEEPGAVLTKRAGQQWADHLGRGFVCARF